MDIIIGEHRLSLINVYGPIKDDVNFYNELLDSNGRYLIMDIIIGEHRLSLINVYGPIKDDVNFYNELLEKVEQLPNDHRIVGGNFNVILDLDKDRKGGSKTTHFKSQETLLRWIDEYDLMDVWRLQHPETL